MDHNDRIDPASRENGSDDLQNRRTPKLAFLQCRGISKIRDRVLAVFRACGSHDINSSFSTLGCIISGAAGAGKTSLARVLAADFKRIVPGSRSFYVSCGNLLLEVEQQQASGPNSFQRLGVFMLRKLACGNAEGLLLRTIFTSLLYRRS